MTAKEYKIPFNKPFLSGDELKYVAEAIETGHISGDGAFTRKASELLASQVGATKVLLTTSCTHALEMAAILLDIKPGDEIIAPSYTFVTTVNAFALRGAKIIFADIRPDTLNIDEQQIADLISDRTRAIIPVHYAGVGCEMDSILHEIEDRNISVVEDNAHGLFGTYKDKPLGSFGSMSTLSFHETKNISCGEGGALVLNQDDLIDRAEIIREKGTNRSQFFRGAVDKYTWVDIGSSYLPSDILSAFLYAQLINKNSIQDKRKSLWNKYNECLAAWAEENGIQTPCVPSYCQQAYHMYYLLLPSLESRTEAIKQLRSKGIVSVFHYMPLHKSPGGKKYGSAPNGCPETESASDRLLRLPFYNGMTVNEQDSVIEALLALRI